MGERQQIASIVAYRIDQDQFEELVQVKNAIQRMSETVVRLARPRVRLRFTHKKSGFTVEGENLLANLKNDEEMDGELIFTNSQGGPAAIQSGTVKWEAVAATGAFTVVQNPDDEKKCTVKGNPQSPGGPEDIGIVTVDFDGDAGEGTLTQHGEGAVNITPGNATTFEVKFGEARSQATT